MFNHLGAIVSRRWALVLAGWAALVLLAQTLSPRWDDVAQDGDLAYLPERMNSVQGQRLLAAAFPEALAKSEMIVVVARNDGPLQPRDYQIADRLIADFASQLGHGPILGVLSYRTAAMGEKLVSPVRREGQALLIVLQLQSEFMAVANMKVMNHVQEILDVRRREEGFPTGLELGLTGSAATGSDMLLSGLESVRNTERATVLLVIAILLLVYRAPGLVIVPLVVIFASLAVALGLVTTLAELSSRLGWFHYTVFKISRVFIVVILFGAGTDFCLFLIARYQEELEHGLAPPAALEGAMGRIGHAVAASAMTTILGLGTMAFAEFGKSRNGGPTIALCLAIAGMASLTLAPALLRAAGRLVFWPLGPSSAGKLAEGNGPPRNGTSIIPISAFRGFWEWLSHRIIAHPGLILLGSLLLLSPLAYHGFGVKVTYDLPSELQPERPSIKGMKLFERYFPPGSGGPITVLAYRRQGGFATGEALWGKLLRLSDDLRQLEFRESDGAEVRPISSVRTLADPLGEVAGKYGLRSALRMAVLRELPLTQRTYLAQSPEYADRLTRLDVVTRYAPFSPESTRLLDQLDDHLRELAGDPHSEWHGTQFYFAGTVAGIRDLRAVATSDLVRMEILVPLAVFAVLVVILHRPLVSLYLVLSVLLGYYVSLGTADLFFGWINGKTFPGLDWQVPIFLFVILVAVGEDYNIYLITRVHEEQARCGMVRGLRRALISTGGIITGCGIIMAGTFASMIAGTLRTVQELGVAFSFGILLDTFVIRTILVPAFLVLWDSRRRQRGARILGGPSIEKEGCEGPQ